MRLRLKELSWLLTSLRLWLMFGTTSRRRVDAKTFIKPWIKLQMAFLNKSAMRILSLDDKLSRTKRVSCPVVEYLKLIKSIVEELSLCGSSVADVDLMVHVLSTVRSEFQDIAVVIHSRDTIIHLMNSKTSYWLMNCI